MSATNTNTANLLAWLEENAFWNADLVQIQKSRLGGLGVFWTHGAESPPDDDRMLLRIPKSNILSPKNSFIFSLVADYEPEDPTVDFTAGMHAIVLTFIYEHSAGESSPWYGYIESFAFDPANVPICLWTEEEKKALFNTECDLLNMLDPTELISFYKECIAFANKNKHLVAVPDVLNSPDFSKIHLFGQFVQAVISRAFTVDKYHGLSLVPGADLFNHLSPKVVNGEIQPRESVHFVCDDDDDLCEECGEIGCDHLEEESDEEEEEMEEEVEEEESENEEEFNFDHLMEDIEVADSESEEDDENDEDEDSEEDEESHESDQENEESSTKITMEDIEQMELGSEAETDLDDEEVSTLSLSDEEPDGAHTDLAKELSDGAKCCDVVLTGEPSKDYDYELFNTYGNELSNAYLLQRYGFISEQNPNTSCLLSVSMFAYLKGKKAGAKGREQLNLKLQWYEDIGFSMVNDIVESQSHNHGNHDHDHEHDENSENENGNENGCGDDCGDCGDGCGDGCKSQEMPESWQLSPRIAFDGNPTPQTLALIRLVEMPFKVFHYKLQLAPSERKLEKRVDRLLLGSSEKSVEKSVAAIVKSWVQNRLKRYKKDTVKGVRGKMIEAMKAEEKAVLQRALELLK